jgi:N-acetylglucosaminyldiphosphoundecaprenol N-acetyl-beta-D-mannosaminyltransferase
MDQTHTQPLRRVDVLGVQVTAGDLDRDITEIGRWIATGEHHYVCVTGVHGVIESQADPELLAIHNASGLTTTDGMPLVWCCRKAGFPDTQRVYGPDLLPATIEAGIRHGWRHYFYGGADGVPEQLAENLQRRFPGMKVVGTMSPPFRALTAEEDDEIVAEINAVDPDIVWVGLSTPKQERWMASHVDRLNANALVGVGAAFDFHAGTVRQAPRWVQRSGLEWAFRLAIEPRRLWRRYVRIVPTFLWRIFRNPPKAVGAE